MIRRTTILVLILLWTLMSVAQKAEYTISGYISDESSSEKLISANVFNGETYVGTTTNNFGFYSLTLPAGKVLLQVSYIGYEDRKESKKMVDIIYGHSIKKNQILIWTSTSDI